MTGISDSHSIHATTTTITSCSATRRHNNVILSVLLIVSLLPSSSIAFLPSSSSRHHRVSSVSPASSIVCNAYVDGSSLSGPSNHNKNDINQQQQHQQPRIKSRPPKVHPQTGGRITLVGSGPGSPSLLTLAAHELITNPANLLIVDRLVSTEILALMSSAGVDYKIANKTPGCQMAAQDEIFEWCKTGLQRGKHVVRLKIGDPFVFGRGGEEVLQFRDYGVEPTVIPGVSAAFSAPLLASIPVTHRGIANQVVMCTGYGKNNTSPELIRYHPEQTVVFLMAVGRLRNLCESLIAKAGFPAEIPVGIVERAGCPEQRTVVGTLESIADLAERYEVRPPSTIVVGEVVNVLLTEEDFVWHDEHDDDERGEDGEREEMGRMMRSGYHGLVQSIYSE